MNTHKVRLYILFIFSLLFSIASGTAQSISTFSTDLPLLIINSNGAQITQGPKVTASMKLISNPVGTPNRFSDTPNEYNGSIGIKVRGSSSAYYPQTPYSIETRTADGENNNVPLLGMPKENDWILISNYNDKSLMRNVLAFQFFEALGNYAPRARLVDVIVNNEYRGIYVFTERIKRDKNRVDIAKLRPKDIEGEEVTGGYIFKVDYRSGNDHWQSPYKPIGHPEFNVYFVYHDPEWDELVDQQKNYIRNYVTTFESILYSPEFDDPVDGYNKYIDVASFIDYFIISEVSRNNDGFKKSRYFHKDKNGKIFAGPVWDFDWAWKNINECFIFKATDGSGWAYKINDCYPDNNSPGWMLRLFEDEQFRNQLQCRYTELRQTVLSNESIFKKMDSVQNLVANAQIKHFQRWQILGINVGAPEIGHQPTTYAGEVTKLKDWIALRLEWLDLNMAGSCFPMNTPEDTYVNQIHIYPNPANIILNIESEEKITQLQMVDFYGRVVDSFVIPGGGKVHKMDVKKYSSGIYFLKIMNNKGKASIEKVVIQNQ